MRIAAPFFLAYGNVTFEFTRTIFYKFQGTQLPSPLWDGESRYFRNERKVG